MPYPVGLSVTNLDQLTLSQISTVAGGLTGAEFAYFRQEVQRRYNFDLVPQLEAEPNNLLTQVLRHGQLFMIGTVLGGLAANNSIIALFNAANSGVRVLVFDIWSSTVAAGVAQLYTIASVTAPVGFGNGPFGVPNQTNLTGGTIPKTRTFTVQNVGTANLNNSIDQRQTLANTLMHWGPGTGEQAWYELTPGNGLAVMDGTVNDQLLTGFLYMEVPDPGPSTE
jgi:hypothetical protein